MSTIIRAGAAGDSVQPFGGRVPQAAAGAIGAPAADESLSAKIERENERLRKELDTLRAAVQRSCAEAGERGRQEGLAAATTREADRLNLLGDGIAAAVSAWSLRLETLEGLAASLSRTSLSAIFGNPDIQAELVAAALGRQMENLRAETVLAITVSEADFPDAQALAAITAKAATVVVNAAPDLAPGECRIDLAQGHIDAGPRSQWPHLSRFLEKLELEAGAA